MESGRKAMSWDSLPFSPVRSTTSSSVVSASLLSGLGFSEIDGTLNSKQEQNLNKPWVTDP